jgi:flagellar hook-associated protein 1 FlgK
MTINSVIDDNDHIAAAKIDTLGKFAVGDNRNALDIADLQYKEVSVQRWTYSRGSDPTSVVVLSPLEDYYHTLVSSLGIKSESITRGREFHESVVAKLTEVRDSISAVSLDEEMANLIKFQHAYAAAAKLITISDEMFVTLLDSTE